MQSSSASLPAADNLPEGQLAQATIEVAPEDSEYVFASHCKHAASDELPGVDEYFPATQLLQCWVE